MSQPLKEAKLQADRLTQRLRDLGVTLKRTQALEGIAAVHNFTDWNRYQAHLERAASGDVELLGAGTFPPASAASSTAHRVLLMRPGEGKSSILALMLADEIRTGRGIPVWIDCNNGSPSHVLPPFVAEQVSRIDVHFDKDEIDFPEPPRSPRAIWISLTGLQTYNDEGKWNRTRAFCALAEALRTSWPASLVSRFSLTLIDETHVLDESQPVVFGNAIPALAFDRAQVLVATQYLQSIPACPIDFELISTKETINHLMFTGRLQLDIDRVHFADAARLSRTAPALDDERFSVDAAASLISYTLSGHRYKTFGESERAWLFKRMIDSWNSARSQQSANSGALQTFVQTAKDARIVVDHPQELFDELRTAPRWMDELPALIRRSENIRLWCAPHALEKCRDDFMQQLMSVFLFTYAEAYSVCITIRPAPDSSEFIKEIKEAGIVIDGEQALTHLLSGAHDEWCTQLVPIFRTARKHGIGFRTPTGQALEAACDLMARMRLSQASIAAFRQNTPPTPA